MSDRYATKPVGSQKMEIIQVLNLEDLPPCQMLYMSRRTAKELPLVLKHLQGKNTMLVTHIEGPAKPGATINFVIQESKIYFEVNLKEARKRKIVIGSKLIQWAIKS
jgi:hypothetical protein